MNNHKNSGLPVVPLYYSVPLLAICVIALLILVFVFKIEVPVALFAPPANAVNVSACGILTQNDTYYVLNTSLNTSGICITLQANGSTIDGLDSYNISGHGLNGFGSIGIKISGNGNVVKGMNISNFYQGIFNDGNGTTMQNNHISNSSYGFWVANAVNVSVRHNRIQDIGTMGIYYSSINCLGGQSVIDIYNNSIIGNNFAMSRGISLQNSNNCKVSSNVIRFFSSSLHLVWSSDHELTNNLLENSENGIYSSSSNRNNFVNNIIRNSSLDAIYLASSISNFSNTIVEKTNLSYNDLKILGSNSEVNLIDTSLAKYNLTNTIIRFISLGKGAIAFVNPRITANGTNLSSDVKIASNFAAVDSVSSPGFNKSALIRFEGILTTLVNPTILRDGVLCSPNICSSLTTPSPGNVQFNVNSWTNYSIDSTNIVLAVPQMINITEPDPSENYSLSSFPVVFSLVLNQTGRAWFTLGNGTTNFTMNSDDDLSFNYIQNNLPAGNYVFTVYANFTGTTQKATASVNFSVGALVSPPVGPYISIVAPDSNQGYHVSNFPVSFVTTLSQAGKAWFTLGNGTTNFTMMNSSSTNTHFTYSQSALAVGNYVFTAYANFTGTTQKSTASVNFSVNDTVSSSATPSVIIEEPDTNEAYSVNNLPVLFIATLSQSGKAWFSLNNGEDNFTMVNSSANNTYFTYSKGNLSIGNYTLKVYANFTGTTQNNFDSVNFRIVNGSQSSQFSGGPTATINEPSTNENYYLNNFPVVFVVDLSQPGKAWFSLNNGTTNFTMANSSNSNTHFTYSQNTLPVGDYTFTAYANFTGSTQKYKTFKNFKVLNTPGPPLNTTTGSNNNLPLPPLPTSSGKVEFKHIAYWLVVAVLSVAIVILILLIIKYFKTQETSKNAMPSNIVSRLR